jgi:hypothetical protein
MSTTLWNNFDGGNAAPIWAATALKLAPTRANANVIFSNSNVALFASESIGVYGLSVSEIANTTGQGKSAAHTGWVQRTGFMGPVISITANANSYGTNSFITFSGGQTSSNTINPAGQGTGNTSANATVSVAANGRIQSITINSGGLYLTTPNATPVSGNAAFTVTMGGRANRFQYEVLVASNTIFGDASSDDHILPQ